MSLLFLGLYICNIMVPVLKIHLTHGSWLDFVEDQVQALECSTKLGVSFYIKL